MDRVFKMYSLVEKEKKMMSKEEEKEKKVDE
jgi:hypothetical protein